MSKRIQAEPEEQAYGDDDGYADEAEPEEAEEQAYERDSPPMDTARSSSPPMRYAEAEPEEQLQAYEADDRYEEEPEEWLEEPDERPSPPARASPPADQMRGLQIKGLSKAEIEEKIMSTGKSAAEAREEAEVQLKLVKHGKCEMGYPWRRDGAGWRCEGGSHYVTNEELAKISSEE